MPEWSVCPSKYTVPVKVPVLGSVGDFVQETAKKTKRTHEKHRITRKMFLKRVRELRKFTRILLRLFFKALVCIKSLSNWENL